MTQQPSPPADAAVDARDAADDVPEDGSMGPGVPAFGGADVPPPPIELAREGAGSEGASSGATSASGGHTPRWRRIARLEFLDGFVDACRGWLLWMTVVGVAPGLALWPLLHREDPKFKLANVKDHLIKIELTSDEQVHILKWAVASWLVTAFAYVVLGWLARRRERNLRWSDYFARLNVRLIPVMLLPVFSALLTEELEVRLQLLTLALAAAVGIALGYWHYQTAGGGWRARLGPRLATLERWHVPDALMLCVVFAYGTYFGWLSVLDHRSLGTHIYDLGLYDNTFWNTVNGDTMACSYLKGNTHISAHVDPIIILLSPIYALSPRAETLLWLQAYWIAMGGVPLYLHAKRTLGSGWQAVVVLALFYLAPSLHGINMFDFHSLALMIPLVMWAVYLLDIGKLWAYWIVIPLLLLTREDMPFVACFIAVYAIMIKRRRTGIITMMVAVAYLVVVKMKTNALLAGDKDGYSYSYYYEEMIPDADEGLPGLVVSTFSDPIAALSVLLKPGKLLYWGKVFLPLLFIPLFGRGKRVLYLYGVAFIGLVSREHVYSVHFQYSSVLLPFLMMGFPDGLQRVTSSAKIDRIGIDRVRLRRALLFGALACTLVISGKFGAIVPNKIFRAGWNRLDHSPDDKSKKRYKEVRRLIDLIPQEASVCSSSSLGPHLSNRKDARKWPACSGADYVFINNKGLKKRDAQRRDGLRKRRDYVVEFESKSFIMFRKLSAEEREAKREEARSQRKRPTPKARAKEREEQEGEALDDEEEGENPYDAAEGGDTEQEAPRIRPRKPPPSSPDADQGAED
jgi:uncharacterized membrane protein